MVTNCVQRDEEILRNIFVRLPSGEVAQDVSLTGSKAFGDRTATEAFDRANKFVRANDELASRYSAYRGNYVTRRPRLLEESGAPSFDGSSGKVVTVGSREHHDLRGRTECENISSPLAAIAVR